MSKRLYVGNLPFSTTDDSMKELFSSYGNIISASVLVDKMTGRSRGFGFVELEEDDKAMQAIDDLNGKEWEGRKLVVNEARPMSDRPRTGGSGGRGGFGGGNRGGGFGGGRDRF